MDIILHLNHRARAKCTVRFSMLHSAVTIRCQGGDNGRVEAECIFDHGVDVTVVPDSEHAISREAQHLFGQLGLDDRIHRQRYRIEEGGQFRRGCSAPRKHDPRLPPRRVNPFVNFRARNESTPSNSRAPGDFFFSVDSAPLAVALIRWSTISRDYAPVLCLAKDMSHLLKKVLFCY